MKILLILLLVPLFVLPVFGSIQTTDGGSLDVEFTTMPEKIIAGEDIKMNVVFINPQTQKTQIHIDYHVTVLEDGVEIFGPTNRIHTSEGKAKIPIQFKRDGQYQVKIDTVGILFNEIPRETVLIPLTVGGMPPVIPPEKPSNNTNGCLVATATFGSELSDEVQMLREIRDDSLLTTKSGTVFMNSFNQFYYSFSPVISDWERQNPMFKEAVKITITPLLSTLSILNHVSMDSESEVLGYGISIIALNLAMYVGLPLVGIFKIRQVYRK